MISLYAWAKREDIAYSRAQKLLAEGRIIGAIRNGNRILVPETSHIPPRDTVQCAVCGREFPQITGTHLKLHGTTLDEYRTRFPEARTIGADVLAALSAINAGKPMSEEQKQKISDTKKGTVAWNKGLVGVYTASDEARRKMSEAQRGRKHTEETKKKIGEGNRGKIMPKDDVERRAALLREKYETQPGPFAGKNHNDASRARMKVAATEREANYTREQRVAINKAIGNSVRGIKRTDEQKERYRASRVKWMTENPTKVINTAGERSIAEWLDKNRIVYQRQFVIPGLHHPYDFYLPDHETIIEFDGAHHWWRRWFNVLGKTPEEREQMLQETLLKDAIENLYAGLHGYRIIRIRGVADVGDSEEYGSLENQLRVQGFLFDPVMHCWQTPDTAAV